ncbi:unnamed protein product [Ilex paraguariensis]|uniref:FLZ-type domain-containing protein n=1 Tax=Ilex paraguariensis TaxID=185542 RepID=A0ABC8RKW4_9AQUA
MVGLSVVLEEQKFIYNETPQVINKVSMIKPSSPTTPRSPSTFSRRNFPSTLQATSFLDHCSLCKHKLLPGKDIYMYKGDRAFCSVECRCRQIFMDEEESVKTKRDNCSLAAMKPQGTSSSSSPPPPSPRSRKGARNRGNGFAY